MFRKTRISEFNFNDVSFNYITYGVTFDKKGL